MKYLKAKQFAERVISDDCEHEIEETQAFAALLGKLAQAETIADMLVALDAKQPLSVDLLDLVRKFKGVP